MDGRGQVGTYHFSHDDWGQPGAGHRGQLPPATPLAPPMCVINSFVYFNCRSLSLWCIKGVCIIWYEQKLGGKRAHHAHTGLMSMVPRAAEWEISDEPSATEIVCLVVIYIRFLSWYWYECLWPGASMPPKPIRQIFLPPLHSPPLVV